MNTCRFRDRFFQAAAHAFNLKVHQYVFRKTLPCRYSPSNTAFIYCHIIGLSVSVYQTCSNEVKCICDRDYTGKDCSVFDPIPKPTVPSGPEKKGPYSTPTRPRAPPLPHLSPFRLLSLSVSLPSCPSSSYHPPSWPAVAVPLTPPAQRHLGRLCENICPPHLKNSPP